MGQARWQVERVDVAWRWIAGTLLLMAAASCTLDAEPHGSPRRRSEASPDEAQTVVSRSPDVMVSDAQAALDARSDDARQPAVPDLIDATAPDARLDASCGDEDALCHEPTCKTAADCKAPNTPCSEPVCDDGHCGVAMLAAGARCAADGVCDEHGACRECTPGRMLCLDATALRTCDATGHWPAATSCEHGCLGDACAQCTPAAADCAGTQRRVCGADGHWAVAETCVAGCNVNVCNQCMPGQTECTVNDSSARVCNVSGLWDAAIACSSGCANGRCNDCPPGAKRCTSSGAQTCGDDRQWGPAKPCDAGCNGDHCAECKNGAIECASATSLRVCANNTWGATDSCRPHATCDATRKDGNTCPCDSGYSDPHPNPGACTKK